MQEVAVEEPANKARVSGPPSNKQAVSKHMAEKWVEYDKTLTSLAWLRVKATECDCVVLLNLVCCQHTVPEQVIRHV